MAFIIDKHKIFIHACRNTEGSALRRSYWLNAVNGLEDTADSYERLAADIIKQVTGQEPDTIISNVASYYKKMTDIEFVDPSHFIIDLYVTQETIRAMYVRRDLNFIPRGEREPLIEYTMFQNINLNQLGESGIAVANAVKLSRTIIRNSQWGALAKNMCFTYTPTSLLYFTLKYISGSQSLAFYSSAIIPTTLILGVLPYMIVHFKKERKADTMTPYRIIPFRNG